ncbi:PspC domain-containing protein [Blastococcus sp. SYSU D00695]
MTSTAPPAAQLPPTPPAELPPAPPAELPPAPPAGPGSRPPLQRARTGTMLGGVCRGLADATGTDVVLWRAGVLVLALTGVGLLAYGVAWVALPAAPLPPGGRPAPLDPCVERLHGGLSRLLSGSRRG